MQRFLQHDGDFTNMFVAQMDTNKRCTVGIKIKGGCVGVDLEWVGLVWGGGEFGAADDVQEVACVRMILVEKKFFLIF
ncbi:hypothetical protein FF1_023782 [Malus domestica]